MMPGRAILIVEDHPSILRMLDVCLRHYGLTPILAAAGRQAVSLYQQNWKDIGLVLLDVQMSDMDGPQTAAALRELDPRVRFCFMTAHSGRYTAEELLATGAIRVFQKPFSSMADLAQVLSQLLVESRAKVTGLDHDSIT
jgi:CheY-like chemotaxis protein